MIVNNPLQANLAIGSRRLAFHELSSLSLQFILLCWVRLQSCWRILAVTILGWFPSRTVKISSTVTTNLHNSPRYYTASIHLYLKTWPLNSIQPSTQKRKLPSPFPWTNGIHLLCSWNQSKGQLRFCQQSTPYALSKIWLCSSPTCYPSHTNKRSGYHQEW